MKATKQVFAVYDGKAVDMSYIPNAKERFKYAAMRVHDNAGKGYVIEDADVFEIIPGKRRAYRLSADDAQAIIDKFASPQPLFT